jgi:hypothetical protein
VGLLEPLQEVVRELILAWGAAFKEERIRKLQQGAISPRRSPVPTEGRSHGENDTTMYSAR